MRPDLEDFDDLNEQDNEPRSKAMAWLVLGVALCGFTSLAYYAYHSGTQSMRDASIEVVDADSTPIKDVPEDPQGEQFPNKDKTIYDTIAADDAANGEPAVEKLLPEAEQAIVPKADDMDRQVAAVKSAPSTTTTFVNEAKKTAEVEPEPVDAPIKQVSPQAEVVAAAPSPAAQITPLTTPVKPAVKAAPKASAPPAAIASAAIRASDFDKKPAEVAKPVAAAAAPVAKEVEIAASEEVADDASAAAPEMVNVKSITSSSKPTSELKDAQAKAKAAPAPVAAAGGAYKVQLGAFKSEAEAAAQWKKITAKSSDVIHGTPIIVKADLPNGTFYRLRASGFASADAAKAACAKLAARSQACFPAGK